MSNGRVGGLNRGLRLLTAADIPGPKVPQCLPPRYEKGLVSSAPFLGQQAPLAVTGPPPEEEPSPISRSRAFASSAESSAVIGGGSRVSNAAPGVGLAEGSSSPAMGRAKAGTQAPWIGDPG
jgi:hypothetical protein